MVGNLAREMTDDELQSVSGGRIYVCVYIGGGWWYCEPLATSTRAV